MKFLVFIFLYVCVVNCYQQHPQFQGIKLDWQGKIEKYLDVCVKESGVDPVLALRIFAHGEYADDYKLKCFIKCLAYQQGAVNEDGTAIGENFMKVLNIEDSAIVDHGFIDSCFAIKLNDPCETAYKISECTYTATGKAIEALYPVQ